jgi:glycosyltransferase involved in cell wall biosynthesis
MGMKEYILVTPCKNEEESLPALAESVVNQTIKPRVWVIVDDGSTDKTPEILQKLTSKHHWIRTLRLKEKPRDLGVHVSHVYRTGFDYATNCCKNEGLEFNYVCSVDADIILDDNYFELLICESENNQSLGVCSGYIGNIIDGKTIWIDFRDDLPSGGARLWNKKCFEDTGGYLLTCSPDSVSNVKAKIRGWETRQFEHVRAVSTRAYAGAEGQWKGYKKMGSNHYFIGCGPLYAVLKGSTLMYSRNNYFKTGVGIAYITGYFREYLKKAPRINDREVLAYYGNKRLLGGSVRSKMKSQRNTR